MQIGAVYPQIELGGSPEALRRFATATEELGYDHLVAYDHVLGAVHEGREPALWGPYTENDPFHDPLVMFAYLAAITPRLEFFSGVLILPQRQTALVARQAADLQLFCDGRFRLGVGVGWNYVEYDALGQDFSTRGKREEEQVALLRKLWTEPVVDFAGRFDRVERAALVPKPSAPIPIWMGGFSDAAFARAARIADGFVFSGRAANVVEVWDQMREAVVANGRRAEDFGGEAVMFSTKGPARVAELMHEWGNAGGTHTSVVTMNLGFTEVEQHVDYLNQVREALGS
jgi:probable F420-dependent oxidoreductase